MSRPIVNFLCVYMFYLSEATRLLLLSLLKHFSILFCQICIHRMLSHDSVIKFFGHRRSGSIEYLFLEYASGGELFDRIGNFSSHCDSLTD